MKARKPWSVKSAFFTNTHCAVKVRSETRLDNTEVNSASRRIIKMTYARGDKLAVFWKIVLFYIEQVAPSWMPPC